jgi:hypothetical protein
MWWMSHMFAYYVIYSLFMKCPIWVSMFLNKALVSTNCYNMVVIFTTMVEKCSYTLSFFFLVIFFNLIWSERFLHYSLLPSTFETLSNFAWDSKLLTFFFTFISKNTHMFHHISTSMPPTIMMIIAWNFVCNIVHPCIVCKLH